MQWNENLLQLFHFPFENLEQRIMKIVQNKNLIFHLQQENDEIIKKEEKEEDALSGDVGEWKESHLL